MVEPTHDAPCPSRRTVMSVGAGVTLAACAGALAACGTSSKPASGGATSVSPGGAPTSEVPSSPATGSATQGGVAPAVVKAAIDAKKVPVGGAIALADGAGILAQPTAGKYTLYAAECTHQGVKLTTVSGTTTTCTAHGSQFDALTGAVKKGPATASLRKVWESA